MSRILRFVGVGALLALVASCSEPGAATDAELVGTAQLALAGVPADGTCVEVTAAGNRNVTRAFDLAAGSTSVQMMTGLPVGRVTFTARAFAGSCAGRGAAAPTWVTDAPFTATVAVSPAVLVTLNLVRNGNASVSIGFDDDAPSPDGGAASDGAAADAGSAGGASTLSFMRVAPIAGASTTTGFEGWFNLDSFALTTFTAGTTTGGGGGGASKTTWGATARLRYQKGTPELYNLAVTGKNSPTVELVVQKGGATPSVFWKATLTNALVSGIESNGAGQVPDLTVTFVFSRVDVEYSGGRLADGSPGPTETVFWNLQMNTGSGAPNPRVPLQFVVGGPATPPAKAATSFHAPSEVTATSPAGGGGGAGKPVFGDASLSLGIDGSVLQLLIEQSRGLITPTASVEIDTAGPMGPTPFGTYGFKNVQLHGLTLSGLDATLTFGATAFEWTVGSTTVSYPTP